MKSYKTKMLLSAVVHATWPCDNKKQPIRSEKWGWTNDVDPHLISNAELANILSRHFRPFPLLLLKHFANAERTRSVFQAKAKAVAKRNVRIECPEAGIISKTNLRCKTFNTLPALLIMSLPITFSHSSLIARRRAKSCEPRKFLQRLLCKQC